ncbi:hypothetical protein L6452_40580 [Arctium lappa]|uniref:Uncharacterized protein n=1 Tax=Arctium lappa TaxID=4217 RepID=A0ACB8XN19_ARCLA|nr:hypothetical protein L6452_40580 [Arctium lappa]
MKQVDDASLLFQKICQNGHEPNQWTYETLVHGFCRHGRKTDAKVWVEEMLRRGFVPSTRNRKNALDCSYLFTLLLSKHTASPKIIKCTILDHHQE